MAVEWDCEKMNTGLLEIDEQHREWIRQFKEFDDAVINQKGQEVLKNALRFLEQYTEAHFTREEAYMEEYNCPGQSANRAAHDEFRAKFSEIKRWVEKEGANIVEVMALELALEEWLTNHICTIDVQLRNVTAGS